MLSMARSTTGLAPFQPGLALRYLLSITFTRPDGSLIPLPSLIVDSLPVSAAHVLVCAEKYRVFFVSVYLDSC